MNEATPVKEGVGRRRGRLGRGKAFLSMLPSANSLTLKDFAHNMNYVS